MEETFSHIHQTSNKSKLKVIFISSLAFLLFIAVVIFVFNVFQILGSEYLFMNEFRESITNEINSFSKIGLFYTGLLGGLFFIPIPQELFFYSSLLKGSPIFLSFAAINIGFLIAQLINYFVGYKLSKPFMHLVSKKRLYSSRRYINKHGGKGVFLFNLLPLPAPILTFGLGIAKYNFSRLFFYTISGITIKYAVMSLVFLLTT